MRTLSVKILEAIEKYGDGTVDEIAAVVKSSRAVVYILLERQRSYGRVSRKKVERSFVYSITQHGMGRLKWERSQGKSQRR